MDLPYIYYEKEKKIRPRKKYPAPIARQQQPAVPKKLSLRRPVPNAAAAFRGTRARRVYISINGAFQNTPAASR